MITNRYISEEKGIVRKLYYMIVPENTRKKIFEYRFIKNHYAPKAKRYFEKFQNNEEFIFETVFIETVNRCNNVCPFCPVNINKDTREYCEMTDELFKKIIDELCEMNYAGKVALYSNNEPFLDKKIIERCEYARTKLPKAYIYLFTNGLLLNNEVYQEAMKYLDKMVIDNYNDEMKLIKPVRDINKLCEENEDYNKRTEIKIRKMNEVLSTRGGQSPNASIPKTIKTPCYLLFTQFVIRPDGKVSLCCSDALGKYSIGDVNNQRIIDIWKNDNYKTLREKMMSEGRAGIELCKYCDFIKGN